jgi:predicted GIY-YIG superfamily endonuclease
MKNGFLYLIRSKKHGNCYLGSTDNPRIGIKKHNSENYKATKNGIPWTAELVIKLESLSEARKVEYYIKTYKEKLTARDVIRILNEYFRGQ